MLDAIEQIIDNLNDLAEPVFEWFWNHWYYLLIIPGLVVVYAILKIKRMI